MGVSSGEDEVVEVRSGDSEKAMSKKDGCGSVLRWERFLPRMALRVLLVEADDSTRQIIAALLRKCNYKVAAVPDGLKAWEVLKGRPQNIDLILTEVELPSISGYALLTLIMEHEICKNIPVIMMSSNDSISTVYKCMLRGAADFLVKPIRKNELRNMWQHVWRRRSQSTIDKNGPCDESFEEQKVEATAENATSDHLSGYKACGQGDKECVEKGSDAQSSCTKPDMEAESSYVANMQDLSQPNWSRSLSSDMKLQMHSRDVKSGQELLTQKLEAGGPAVATLRVDNTSWSRSLELERPRENHNDCSKACENNELLLNSSRKAIDLIGSFDNYMEFSCRSSSSNNDKNKFDFFPRLDLTLRRPVGSENQTTEEKHTLNHSNASAFSRYVNSTLQPLCLAPAGVCSQEKEYRTRPDQHPLTHATGYNSEASGSTLNAQRSMITMATGQFGQAETVVPSPQDGAFTVSAPVPSINFDGLSSGLGSALPSIFYNQSGPSSIQSPSSVAHQDGAILVNQHQSGVERIDSIHVFEAAQISNNLSQAIPKEPLDDQANFSSAPDQSASSRFCNGTVSHLNSIACVSICGSNNTINPASIGKTSAEAWTEEGLAAQNNNCCRSQREAALMKFRLKRKDRCFEKKVRYESRKKLAEQRPRVKGQFVRQLSTEPTPQEIGGCSGNSPDG